MAEQIHIFNAGKRVALVRNGVTEYVNRVDFAIQAINAETVQISNANFSDYLVTNYANVLHPEGSDSNDLVARVESLIDLRQPNYGSGDGDTIPYGSINNPQDGDVLVWDGFRWINEPREQNETITKSQITANQNNYVLGPEHNFRLSSDATRDITGISGGYDGKIITLYNIGPDRIRFTNQGAGSTATNRIITGTGTTYQMNPGESVQFKYDGTEQRWRRLM